jgi:hypothetical protein
LVDLKPYRIITDSSKEDADPHLLSLEIQNCASADLTLTLWSAKGSQFRTLRIAVPATPVLNLTLQWAPLSLTSSVWHILSVSPHSPAEKAGLLPYGDYVIGTPSGQLRGESGLGELVEDHINRPLELYVYNHEYNVTRLVTITPSRQWGGEGALGCMLGFGALHRLPAPLDSPPAAPGEALFDTTTDRFSNEEKRSLMPSSGNLAPPYPSSTAASSSEFLVPANVASPPPRTNSMSPSKDSQAAARGGRKKHTVHSPKRAMDDYFKEGEQKSKEEEFTPASKGAPPPPPKAGAPPKSKEDQEQESKS